MIKPDIAFTRFSDLQPQDEFMFADELLLGPAVSGPWVKRDEQTFVLAADANAVVVTLHDTSMAVIKAE